MKNFFNDDDGFSAKDFIMVIFASCYLVMIVYSFIISFKVGLNSVTLDLIKMLEPIVMTVIGGVFAVSTAKLIKGKPKATKESEAKEDNKPLI